MSAVWSVFVSSLVAAAAPAGEHITLDQALRIADAANQDLAAARARLDQAEELSWKAWSGTLPHLLASGNYTLNSDEARIPFGGEEIVIQQQHQFSLLVELSQALVTPTVWSEIRNSYRAERVADLETENTRRAVLLAVVQMYYRTAAWGEAIAIQERLLEGNREQEREAALRVEVGAANRVTSVRAQIERAVAEQDLLRTRNNYADTLSSLAMLLAREPDFAVARPEALPAPVPEGVPEGDVLTAALRQRPDALAAEETVALTAGGELTAWLRYAPVLTFVARGNFSNTPGFTGKFDTWNAGVAAVWSLFDGGLRESDLRTAWARSAEAEANAQATRLRVADELRRYRLDLESAQANQRKAEERVHLAQENSQLVAVAFETGTATAIEVVDASSALRSAELIVINERLAVDLAGVRLAHAAGLFDPLHRPTGR